MKRFILSVAAALLAGVCAALAGTPALAQGVVKSTIGDWELRCDTPPGRSEQCVMLQRVADDADPNTNLVVVVLKVTDEAATNAAQKKANEEATRAAGRDAQAPAVAPVKRPVLRVIAPLGILLPSGLGLKIESTTEKNAQGQPLLKDIGNTGFVKCLPNGCVAEVELEAGLVSEFRAGKVAQFIFFTTPTEGRGLPLNLQGFAEGFEQLK
jgi:invasion protein IalB